MELILLYGGLLLIIGGLIFMQVKKFKFTTRVFTALIAAITFGIIIKALLGDPSSYNIGDTLFVKWLGLIGGAYTNILKLVVIPLIVVSILSAVINIKKSKSLGKIVGLVIAVLMITTAISSVVGIVSARTFNLQSNSALVTSDYQGKAKTKADFANKAASKDNSIPTLISNLIPKNFFEDLSNSRDTSIIGVVIFTLLLSIAFLRMPENSDFDKRYRNTIVNGVNAANKWIMSLVKIVISLTAYGIFSLMAKTIATTDYTAIKTLIIFVIASYVALLTVFIIHLILLGVFGYNPIKYLKKSWPLLVYAFTSRSSASAIPINERTQREAFGVNDGVAAISSSLGATIGQNGCAGIYPAMLAVMVAPTVGVTLNLAFYLTLIGIILITSFGVAGVGGGATFASIMVLSALGLPVETAVVLIAIEPLIDMGRTTLNVSGSMLAGLISAKLTKNVDKDTYNDPKKVLGEF